MGVRDMFRRRRNVGCVRVLRGSGSAGMIFNEADQEVRDAGYQRHAFNVLISNRLGFHRPLPDTRDPR